MLINDKHMIINLSARAGRYLVHPGGPVTSDAVANVRPELTVDLSAALHRAFEHNEGTLTRRIVLKFDGHFESVALQVSPRGTTEAPKAALVFFVEGGALDADQLLPDGSGEKASEVAQLRDELFATRTLLRTSREQYETASEQLRSANEELQSINEEYRSTAEELVTSKEELQSINSELQSLNHELRQKYDQEQRAHSDLRNLMGATDIATLFLDRDMRIKRFTPKIVDLFSVQDSDVGRPISDFTHRLENIDLVAEAEHVLADLAPIERNLHSVDGRWFTTRFRPYRTLDERIDGVVVTFFDVTDRREADAAWARRQSTLLGELSHRVKNTLAVVQAVVRHSLTSSGASPEAIDVLLARLRALANAHDLLVKNEWKGTTIEALATEQLKPYVESGQLSITGGSILLPPAIATPLGLMLHELATNAIKYGALSSDKGKVDLFWRSETSDKDPHIEITWRERGGPPILRPLVDGTGMALIRHSISNAQVDFEYEPAGLKCKISIPLSSE